MKSPYSAGIKRRWMKRALHKADMMWSHLQEKKRKKKDECIGNMILFMM